MDKIFCQTYFLTPAECNPQQVMPITLLINRLIEVATLHANQLGIGYEALVEYDQTWVLSRVATEMKRYPGVNETYTIRTWIHSLNRLFSERDFEILDGDSNVVGYARTVWAVIDVNTRAAGDISRMEWCNSLVPDKDCPVEKPRRLRPLPQYVADTYTFTYCDIDFNRHVNSSRYIELLLNRWDLDFHDRHILRRFEINYIHEAYFNEMVEVRLAPVSDSNDENSSATMAELVHDGNYLCRAQLHWVPRVAVDAEG